MRSSGCKISVFWLLGILGVESLKASEILKLKDCNIISRTRELTQSANAGSLIDFSFSSKVELFYPVVDVVWTDASGKTYREEQKIEAVRGGQNFFTLAIPSTLKASSLKITINEQYCYQASLQIIPSEVLAAEIPSDTKFFSVRPEVNQYSMLGLSLLISFALLALVPRRKTSLLTRKLALPE